MKKIILISLLLLFGFTPAVHAELTDDELLNKALVFSKKVKEFGKTIGVEPTHVLAKTTKDIPARSKIIIYMQKKRTLARRSLIDEYLYIHFPLPVSQVPIIFTNLGTDEYSVFYRQVNESADEDMPITIDLAKSPLMRQAEVVLHEDLHMNTVELWKSENVESLVTPLAYLAALHFFKASGDAANEKEAKRLIEYWRKIAVELNDLAEKAENLYSSGLNHWNAQDEIIREIDAKPTYSKQFWKTIKGQAAYDALEAALSADLLYLKYFDKVVTLYEKSGNIELFINDVKKAPGKTEELEKYFRILEDKYSNPVLDK